jgi:hypothetical protein
LTKILFNFFKTNEEAPQYFQVFFHKNQAF